MVALTLIWHYTSFKYLEKEIIKQIKTLVKISFYINGEPNKIEDFPSAWKDPLDVREMVVNRPRRQPPRVLLSFGDVSRQNSEVLTERNYFEGDEVPFYLYGSERKKETTKISKKRNKLTKNKITHKQSNKEGNKKGTKERNKEWSKEQKKTNRTKKKWAKERTKERTKEEMKERTKEGMKERTKKGTKERRKEGTKERTKEGTKERRKRTKEQNKQTK